MARCEATGASIRAPDKPHASLLQVVEQALRNQGVQASEWGDVEGVVTQCGTRVLKTVGLAPPNTPGPQSFAQSLVTFSAPQRSMPCAGSAGDTAAAVEPAVL